MAKICIAHGKYGFLLPVYSGTDLQLKKLAWQMIDKHEIFMRKDRVIARAHNQTERLNDVTAHAEMLAITSATSTLGGKYLNDCTLYVTLEPCVMCGGALAWAQLGELVYGAADPHRGYDRLTPAVLHPKTKVTGGVLEAECGELVKAFFAKKRER